jgi:hypothetical protein
VKLPKFQMLWLIGRCETIVPRPRTCCTSPSDTRSAIALRTVVRAMPNWSRIWFSEGMASPSEKSPLNMAARNAL